jgi:hypothetical protein
MVKSMKKSWTVLDSGWGDPYVVVKNSLIHSYRVTVIAILTDEREGLLRMAHHRQHG